MVVFCLSYSLVLDDSDNLFLDAIGQSGGNLSYIANLANFSGKSRQIQTSLDRITDFSILSFFYTILILICVLVSDSKIFISKLFFVGNKTNNLFCSGGPGCWKPHITVVEIHDKPY